MHLGKALGQKGRQRIGIGVPDQQQLAAVGDRRVFKDAQRLIAAEEGAVFILVLQIAAVIQPPRLLLAGFPRCDPQIVLGHPILYGIRGKPMDTGGGIQGSVEVHAGNFRCKVNFL